MMARRKVTTSNSYATGADEADQAMLAKAAMAEALGLEVSICGRRKNGKRW